MTRHSICVGLPLAAAIALAAPNGASASGNTLAGKEIESLIAGATLTGKTARGDDWTATYGADGTYVVKVPVRNWSEDGKWWVKDDEFCTERASRDETCTTIRHVAEDDYVFPGSGAQGSRSFKIAK